MREETDPWVQKAEGDYEGAVTLYRKRSKSFYHLICFACQQSAEKYLKAFLVENQIKFPKLHDLEKALLPLSRKLDQEFGVLKKYLQVFGCCKSCSSICSRKIRIRKSKTTLVR